MGKLLAVAITIAQGIYGKWLVQRLISGVILLAGLIIITCIMVCSMLIGGLYASYLGLLNAGVTPLLAVAMIGGTLTLITLILAVTTIWYLKNLRTIPKRVLTEKIPAVSDILINANEMLEAFLEGLKTPSQEKPVP